MHTIKKLDWQYREDWVIHADPVGLCWAYYIKLVDDEYELALIDDSGAVGGEITCDNLLDAQLQAQKHYEDTINKHIYFPLHWPVKQLLVEL